MNNHKSEFLGTAFRAAMLAGAHIVENLGRISKDDIDTKQASDFVTRVDKEAEQIILKTIKNKFPDHHFLAEESVKDVNTGTYRWIIDPLDGTTNFIHGYPVFSVSIALELKGEVVLGIVFDPLRNEIFTAEKGKGAYLVPVAETTNYFRNRIVISTSGRNLPALQQLKISPFARNDMLISNYHFPQRILASFCCGKERA